MESEEYCNDTDFAMRKLFPSNARPWNIKNPPCEPRCTNYNGITSFFNDPENSKQLGSDDLSVTWAFDSKDVRTHILPDWSVSQIHHIEALLDANVKVLAYAGTDDYICNWVGGQAWTTAT